MKDTMSKIYLESLDKTRQKFFQTLGIFKKVGYLAGGTALALQIYHRRSEDFDIFIERAIDNKLKLAIVKIFGEVSYYIDTSDQISFKTKEGISITFVWYYFQTIRPLVKTNSLFLSSIEDIAADKAKTLGRRVIWRDYVDLFIFLKWKRFTLEKIIVLAKEKFKGEFVETQFLEQLRYFDGLEITPIEFLKEKYTGDEIKSFLQNEVKKYLKRILK